MFNYSFAQTDFTRGYSELGHNSCKNYIPNKSQVQKYGMATVLQKFDYTNGTNYTDGRSFSIKYVNKQLEFPYTLPNGVPLILTTSNNPYQQSAMVITLMDKEGEVIDLPNNTIELKEGSQNTGLANYGVDFFTSPLIPVSAAYNKNLKIYAITGYTDLDGDIVSWVLLLDADLEVVDFYKITEVNSVMQGGDINLFVNDIAAVHTNGAIGFVLIGKTGIGVQKAYELYYENPSSPGGGFNTLIEMDFSAGLNNAFFNSKELDLSSTNSAQNPNKQSMLVDIIEVPGQGYFACGAITYDINIYYGRTGALYVRIPFGFNGANFGIHWKHNGYHIPQNLTLDPADPNTVFVGGRINNYVYFNSFRFDNPNFNSNSLSSTMNFVPSFDALSSGCLWGLFSIENIIVDPSHGVQLAGRVLESAISSCAPASSANLNIPFRMLIPKGYPFDPNTFGNNITCDIFPREGVASIVNNLWYPDGRKELDYAPFAAGRQLTIPVESDNGDPYQVLQAGTNTNKILSFNGIPSRARINLTSFGVGGFACNSVQFNANGMALEVQVEQNEITLENVFNFPSPINYNTYQTCEASVRCSNQSFRPSNNDDNEEDEWVQAVNYSDFAAEIILKEDVQTNSISWESELKELVFYDITGRKHLVLSENELVNGQFDLNSLPSGFYTLVATAKKGAVRPKKIIVK